MYIGMEAEPGTRVTRGVLPPGQAGTMRTLAMMRGLVHEGARNLRVRNTALSIIRDAGVRPHDTVGEVRALYTWVRDRMRYANDPVDTEMLQGAPYTLGVLSGDCDDYAVLLGSMLRAIGTPADLRFKVIAANPRYPRSFSHVYLVARPPGAPAIPLDPIYPGTPFGAEYAHATRALEVPA